MYRYLGYYHSIVGAFKSRLSIDTRTLALFRILLGSVLLLDVILRLRNFWFFYTERGVVPQKIVLPSASTSTLDILLSRRFSLFFLSESWVLALLLFGALILVSVSLILGYRTTTVTVLAFLLLLSVHNRVPWLLNFGDHLFRIYLLGAIFLPLSRRYSVDSVLRDTNDRRNPVFRFGFCVYSVFCYLCSFS